ncbi:MAG TPA: hypothetical protein VMT03_24710 [Polyangia bacterium]|nr:hypothetical protein [Polyangia bacterium]
MMIYLAADVPLRTVEWREDAPGFNTSMPAPDEQRVRCQFTKPNLVYAGSYEGCGCGFQLGEYPPESLEPDEVVQRRRSLHEFAAYLREELPRVGTIELYACWDGDQETPPVHYRTLTPASFEADTFFFLQKELSTVSEDAS